MKILVNNIKKRVQNGIKKKLKKYRVFINKFNKLKLNEKTLALTSLKARIDEVIETPSCQIEFQSPSFTNNWSNDEYIWLSYKFCIVQKNWDELSNQLNNTPAAIKNSFIYLTTKSILEFNINKTSDSFSNCLAKASNDLLYDTDLQHKLCSKSLKKNTTFIEKVIFEFISHVETDLYINSLIEKESSNNTIIAAIILFKLSKYDTVIDVIRKNTGDKTGLSHYILGMANQHLDKPSLALISYLDFLKYEPDNAFIIKLTISSSLKCFSESLIQKTLDVSVCWLKSHEYDDSIAKLILKLFIISQNSIDKLKDFVEYLYDNTTNIAVLACISKTYFKLGYTNEALRNEKQILISNPKNSNTKYRIAGILASKNYTKLSLETLETTSTSKTRADKKKLF